MLYLYPSNKLEYLSKLLHGVMAHNVQDPMQKKVVLVQHNGMQHWLSINLAQSAGISMQLDFPLPTRFVWETCRSILGEAEVPQQSSYKREVMVWRILDIITAPNFVSSPHAEALSRFWNSNDAKQADLQQFRFAQQLADLFEQYLVFRPDWLLAWDAKQSIDIELDDPFSRLCYDWQLWFWHALVDKIPEHPVLLQQRAMAKLEAKQSVLPEHIYLFAINTIPPGYMSFFNALAKYCSIHWFHLNPSADFWADAKSDRAIALQLRRRNLQQWADDDNSHDLLRNLGKQGKDLLVQLLDSESMEISAFDPPDFAGNNKQNNTQGDVSRNGLGLLQRLQSDILKGASQVQKCNFEFTGDRNIQVHACYHEIRELQVLKDFLLHQLEDHPKLGLDDIIVMCPAIEKYSPFIGGIFESKDEQHLAISISDRQPIESQAVIAAFMQLLALPDSRFSVEQILSLLDTPAVLNRFMLSATDIKFCRAWIENVGISFALDHAHKHQLIAGQNVSNKYTWEWGLERLLVAIFISEEQQMANGVAIAHTIDGHASVTLGKLMGFLSALKQLVHALNRPRQLAHWRVYFDEVLNEFFKAETDDKFAFLLIEQALSAFSENATLADFNAAISVDIARQALKQGLSIPETKSRFMCGKITFCSMMPMRSIPFKVVAILGLNQKTFPRQSYPSELDLIAKSRPRVGDRSRRNDDRYLFLEALVSARSQLFLSYQYRDIQSNAVSEPSLVLKELIEHCHTHYSPSSLPLIEHPLHPFSEASFVTKVNWSGSFQKAWAKHAKNLRGMSATVKQKADFFHLNSNVTQINLQDLVKFYLQPINYFAQERLQLRFELSEMSTYEQPFDINALEHYGLRQKLFRHMFMDSSTQAELPQSVPTSSNMSITAITQAMKASGDLPELPNIDDYLDEQNQDVQTLVEFLYGKCNLSALSGQVAYALDIPEKAFKETSVSAEEPQTEHVIGQIDLHCYIDAEHGMVFPVFKEEPNFKDRLLAWISYVLLLNYANDNPSDPTLSVCNKKLPLTALIAYAKQYRGQTKLFVDKLPVLDFAQARQALTHLISWFIKGNQQVLFVNPTLAKELRAYTEAEEAISDPEFVRKWEGQTEQKGNFLAYDALASNPYFDYFFNSLPQLNAKHLQIYFDVYLLMLADPNDDAPTVTDEKAQEQS